MGYTTDFEGSIKLTTPATPEQVKYLQDFSNSRRMKRHVTILNSLFAGRYGLPSKLKIDPKEQKEFEERSEIVDDLIYKASEIGVTLRVERGLDPPKPYGEGEYGFEGEFFANPGNSHGQDKDDSIIDYNSPPQTQPGLWCGWIIDDDGTEISWDGGEKFYSYVTWMKYIMENFIKPWGLECNGEITWIGEDPSDVGKIIVTNNEVESKVGKIVYE